MFRKTSSSSDLIRRSRESLDSLIKQGNDVARFIIQDANKFAPQHARYLVSRSTGENIQPFAQRSAKGTSRRVNIIACRPYFETLFGAALYVSFLLLLCGLLALYADKKEVIDRSTLEPTNSFLSEIITSYPLITRIVARGITDPVSIR